MPVLDGRLDARLGHEVLVTVDIGVSLEDRRRMTSHPGTTSAVHFWSSATERTDLSSVKERTEPLRSQAIDLFSVTQGLVIHELATRKRDQQITAAQRLSKDPPAADIVHHVVSLHAPPLAEPRHWSQLAVGECFHSAILYCALLRNAGLSARARCGFASYLIPDRWTCHWIVERWDQRWILDDPDASLRDLDPATFRSGVDAWQRCRSHEDPSLYGLPNSTGWPELQGSVVCDVAALAKDEHFSYTHWPLAHHPLPTSKEAIWLDEAATAVEREELPTVRTTAATGFVRLREDCP